jgi:hypothetical protein
MGVELTGLAIQIHGGMGFIEETGVAQHWRDSRITTIYEGTNGIQAMDLVGRKLPMKAGAVVMGLFDDIASLDARLARHGSLESTRTALADALAATRSATQWIFEHASDQVAVLAGATPYLRMLSTLVGGQVMAESALAVLDGDVVDTETREAKVATARFFCEQILPGVHGLSGAVTGDRDLLMSFAADSLSR